MDKDKRFYTLDELYISPFKSERYYDGNGRAVYKPLERNLQPTGMYAADFVMQSLSAGENRQMTIAKGLDCSERDVCGLIRCFTGESSHDFVAKYRLRLAEELLRFTSLTIDEVAVRCGLGTARSLHRMMLHYCKCTPKERRKQLRQVGDEGRYAV